MTARKKRGARKKTAKKVAKKVAKKKVAKKSVRPTSRKATPGDILLAVGLLAGALARGENLVEALGFDEGLVLHERRWSLTTWDAAGVAVAVINRPIATSLDHALRDAERNDRVVKAEATGRGGTFSLEQYERRDGILCRKW